jgi:putative MFS transporter
MVLVLLRFVVGLGVAGVASVDLPLLQEFVPASKRGWISGLSIGLLPVSGVLAAMLSAYLGAKIGWRGLFAVGLVPALMAFVIRVWVPESPRWLFAQGRFEEARSALAWALQIDPGEIRLPTSLPEQRKTPWRKLFTYPRSVVASVMTGLSQTGGVGLALWVVTLLMLVLKVTPARASFLVIWLAFVGVSGRVFGSWLSEALGCRYAGALASLLAALTTSLAGYLHDAFFGAVSVFYIMLLLHSFFGNGNASIVFPYMAELWPSSLRASGFGLVYGMSNLGKFIGPAGLAVIAGASNYVSPKATLAALVPGFNYFAVWYLLAVAAFLFIGIETRGRTIEELDAALAQRAPAPVRVPAQ